jgi:hypothetical protein
VHWWVRFPFFLQTEPREKSDLVTRVFADDCLDSDDRHASEAEAWQAVREYLTAERHQCLADLDFLSKPYTSPSGTTSICPEAQMDEWRQDVRKNLRIAERGLELCAC